MLRQKSYIEIENLVKEKDWKSYDLSFLNRPSFGRWSMEEDICRFIGRVCETLRPRRVLEFGTGLSTLILAHEVSKRNIEKVWSIDHIRDFAGYPKDILARRGQGDLVDFRCFPIRLTSLAGKLLQFYSIPKGFFKETGPLDLVIVDGPPYYYNGREAALYTVYPHLSPRGLLLLDDAERKHREQLYLKNWKKYFGANIENALYLKEFKKGLACTWPTGQKEPFSEFGLLERMRALWVTLKYECLNRGRRSCRLLTGRDKEWIQ